MTGLPTPFRLGTYVGDPNGSSASADAAFAANYSSFVATMGAAPQFLDTYVDYTQSVSNWVNSASWQAWSDATTPDAQDLTPVIGLPMYSTAAGALTPDQQYQVIISGQDDSVLAGIVHAYAAEGAKNLVFRPGWEMNLQGPTFAGSTAQDQADWVAAFQHIYTALHADAAGDGVTATVVWNPGATNYSNVSATTALYPGNDYVDDIGADIYSDIYPYNDGGTSVTYHDWATGGEDTTEAQFIANPINRAHYWSYPAANKWGLDSSGGHSLSLDSIIQFAKQQGKPLAIPETGAGNSNSGTDVQDDPAFPQWLSQQLTAAESNGEKIDFVNIWDSNAGGGNYEFSYAADGKPLEAASWGEYFGGQSPMPIIVTAAQAITTTDNSTARPFTGLAIADPNLTQMETAVVTQSNTGNGTLSDPNAASDGSTDSNGRYTVIGTAASVATALNGLVFTPTEYQVAPGQTVSTTVTAAISDTAGETASVSTTVAARAVAPPLIVIGTGSDTLSLKISEDAYLGNAQFTVSVDGVQVGGVQTAMATHANGQDQTFGVMGNWGAGTHTVAVDFLNDLYAGTPQTDRNLYVDGASYDGTAAVGKLALMSSGTQSLTVGTPMPATTTIGTGSDTLSLKISEDAYLGNAQFTVSVDGVQVGGVQTAMATHANGQDQTFGVMGNWGAGTHTVAVDFLNDLYAGTPQTDRNLYVDGASYDGTAAVGKLALMSSGTQSLTVGTPMPATTTIGTGSDTLSLKISEDAYLGNAQFTVSVDGVQVGGVQTAMATHANGQDQTFGVMGNWGAGTHTVAVDFLNDLYAGTPQTDRNLYVDGASYDGTVQPGGRLTLSSSGTQSFASVSSTAYSEVSGGGGLTTTGNDTVTIGSGAVQINAEGPSVSVMGGSGAMTFIAHGGIDTIKAGSGATTVLGSTGSLTFTDGSGRSNVTLGSGPAVFDFMNGGGGGAITITGFITGTDLLHIQGYAGTGVSSEQESGGSTLITLTDNTRITLSGLVGPYAHPLFG